MCFPVLRWGFCNLAGVQAIVKCSIGHECLYVHCYTHRLVVYIAGNIAEVDGFFGLLQAVCRFFSASTVRHDAFVNAQ